MISYVSVEFKHGVYQIKTNIKIEASSLGNHGAANENETDMCIACYDLVEQVMDTYDNAMSAQFTHAAATN